MTLATWLNLATCLLVLGYLYYLRSYHKEIDALAKAMDDLITHLAHAQGQLAAHNLFIHRMAKAMIRSGAAGYDDLVVSKEEARAEARRLFPTKDDADEGQA